MDLYPPSGLIIHDTNKHCLMLMFSWTMWLVNLKEKILIKTNINAEGHRMLMLMDINNGSKGNLNVKHYQCI